MNAIVKIGDATLYHGDCLEILPTLDRVDAVVTDPPYSAEAHGAGRRVLTHGRDLGRARKVEAAALPFAPLDNRTRLDLCLWASGLCDGWLIAFCQAEAIAGWLDASVAAGSKWVRAAIWVKPDSSPQLSGDRPAQGYESIAVVWCGRGRMKWNAGGKRGVYNHSKHDSGFGHGGNKNEHPTKKPISLMNEIVSDFTPIGSVIVDPFMGSGTTGVACANLGRKFIGIEIERKYFDIACERIEAAYAQGRLFK